MYTAIVDFGLVVLIWIVQLVIYPSFLYFKDEDLLRWHDRYTTRITVVVMPLMIAQAVMYSIKFLDKPSLYLGLLGAMILSCWAITFAISVPLHQKIASGKMMRKSSQALIDTNWYRTILWTLVFIVSLFLNITSH